MTDDSCETDDGAQASLDDLAVLVERERTGEAIAALRSEGIYDGDRHVRDAEDGMVSIPVTNSPEYLDVHDVVRQVDPDYRVVTLEDRLREQGFTDDELKRVPNSWATIGDVILVRFDDCPRRDVVAEELRDLQGADTVLARKGIHGEHREPDVEIIAGSGDTETVHREHGTAYALDLAEVMFSPGNKAERARMGEIVSEGETVLDMFAGVGYFALPMARAGATVTAIERNPTAFRYLVENAPLNDVESRLRPIRADCRDAISSFVEAGESFERVVMGYYDAHEYLDSALAVVDSDGIIHLHEATPDAVVPDRPVDRLTTAAASLDRAVEVLDVHHVKTHSEGVSHVVVDARIA